MAIFKSHEAVGFRLAECATQLEAARQLMRHAASLRDAGLPCLKEAAMAKLFASGAAEESLPESPPFKRWAAMAWSATFQLKEFTATCVCCQIYEGTSDVQKIIIRRALA